MGGGGYVAGPAGLAALSRAPAAGADRGRPPPGARQPPAGAPARGASAWRSRSPGREGDRYLVTGRPVPAAILARRPRRRRAAASGSLRTTAACSSSAAARAPARSTSARSTPSSGTAPRPARDYHVIQIAGHRDYPLARERLDAAGGVERYTLLEYEPTLADALAACDLVLARAGGSVFELAAAGRPAILVPYPHATARHQDANAAWMADAGAARGDRGLRARSRRPGSNGRRICSPTRERLERMSAASARPRPPGRRGADRRARCSERRRGR